MFQTLPEFQNGRRPAVYAASAMAATSHPAATLAALDILRAGGNAVDAGAAAAFLLSVGEPMMTGIGGDMFALYAPPGAGPDDVICLNGSGRAPAGLDADAVIAAQAARPETADLGHVDPDSAQSVTTPCGVAGLLRLMEDHGQLDRGAVLAPAIRAAAEGLPVGPRTARDWVKGLPRLKGAGQRWYAKADGGPYARGERFRHAGLADCLKRIAEDGAAGFYQGEVAADMAATLQAAGGAHTLEDFAAIEPAYATPVRRGYGPYTILTPPPNGQGAVALLLLDILASLPLAGLAPLSVDRLHLEAEAVARAYAARDRLLADPDGAPEAIAALLAPDLGAQLAAEIDPARVTPISAAQETSAPHKDTVYLTVVDADGGALSLIVSIFHDFGLGLASERFGVLFHNRGGGFSVQADSPNRLAACKRPLHTLIPSLGFKDGRLALTFGVMGGQYQAAGQARFLSNIVDFGMDPQAAIDLPRAFVQGGVLDLEAAIGADIREGLAGKGHKTRVSPGPIGGAQAIAIDPALGALIGASDPRKDGCALGF